MAMKTGKGNNMKKETLDAICGPLVGLKLLSVDRKHTYTEGDEITWEFRFVGGIVVWTYGPWRLIGNGRIIMSSEADGFQVSHAESIDAAQRVLTETANSRVVAASISANTGDLVIEFGGHVQLELLQISCLWQAWELLVQDQRYVCTGDGRIAKVVRLTDKVYRNELIEEDSDENARI
ncbi:MAG: hypothetical protein ACM3MF_05980 [Anaerolineae bacterium]